MRSLFIFFLGPLFLVNTAFTQNDTLTIIGVGDIMMGTDYPSHIYLPPGDDCRTLMEDVYSSLQDADITFGNLEGSFAGTKGIPKECKDTTKCFVFRMPPHYVNCLVDAGFDMLSMANNHSNDFGTGGRSETQRVLDSVGLVYAGSISTPSSVLERDGIRYGFIAFAPNKGCYSFKDTVRALSMIRGLRAECDILMVSIHGGAEGADHQHITRESEEYLGYDRGNIYEFAHSAIDAGADIIFGHGPHVTRAAEVYKDRFIIYSLGNFCTYRRFNLRGPNGIAPIMKVQVAPDGRFLRGEIIPVYQVGQGGVRHDPQKRAIKKIQELSREDFPEVPMKIDENGIITLN
ncbi:CapA family protein [Bacteroidota bacterium]